MRRSAHTVEEVHPDYEERITYSEAVQSPAAEKASIVVNYIVGIIEGLLLLRLIFLLLGAREVGFTQFLYSVTYPLVAPFQGIFPAPDTAGGYFATATVVAMIVYLLVGWAINALIAATARTTREV